MVVFLVVVFSDFFSKTPIPEGAAISMIRKLCTAFQKLEAETPLVAAVDETDASVWTLGLLPELLIGSGLTSIRTQISTWARFANEPDMLQLELRFPFSYPREPPFVRVLKPRFKNLTGHVTQGGSICAQFLTSEHWDSTLSIEAMLRSILPLMQEGAAVVDIQSTHAYTLEEATSAYRRMLTTHGWK